MENNATLQPVKNKVSVDSYKNHIIFARIYNLYKQQWN